MLDLRCHGLPWRSVGSGRERPWPPSPARGLTPDDLDQLAAAFRPSWEFDEAPFVGAGSMSPGDIRALQGGGGTPRGRPGRGGCRAGWPTGRMRPAKPAAVSHEPENSVIIDRSDHRSGHRGAVATAGSASRRGAPGHRVPASRRLPVAAPPHGAPRRGPPVAAPAPPPLGRPPCADADRPASRPFLRRRESTGSFDARRAAGQSKRPLWIGLGAGAVALAAVGIWATSSGSSEPPPCPDAGHRRRSPSRLPAPDIPPPPPETTPAVRCGAPPEDRADICAGRRCPAPAGGPASRVRVPWRRRWHLLLHRRLTRPPCPRAEARRPPRRPAVGRSSTTSRSEQLYTSRRVR